MPVRGSVVLVRRSFLRRLKMARVASSLPRKKVPLSPASYCWPFFSEKSALVAVSEMSWVTGSAATAKRSRGMGSSLAAVRGALVVDGVVCAESVGTKAARQRAAETRSGREGEQERGRNRGVGRVGGMARARRARGRAVVIRGKRERVVGKPWRQRARKFSAMRTRRCGGALDARGRERDGLGARRRDARKRHGPVRGRGQEKGTRGRVEREDEFFGRGLVEAAGELLLGGLFGGSDAEAEFAGLRGIEGGAERFAEG